MFQACVLNKFSQNVCELVNLGCSVLVSKRKNVFIFIFLLMATLSADGDAAVPGGRSGGVAQPRRPALPPQGDRHIQTRPGIYIFSIGHHG